MKRKIISVFVFFIVLIFNASVSLAASARYVTTNTYFHIIDTTDSTTTIKSSNVVFTQDDNYYYFDITQVLQNNTYLSAPYSEGYQYIDGKYVSNQDIVQFALMPVNDMKGLYIYPRTVNTPSGGSITITIKLGDTEIAYYNSSSSSGTTMRKNYKMYFSNLEDYYNEAFLGTSTNDVSVINSKNTWVQYSVNDWTSQAKFKILKTKIDNYRYFRFFQKLYWQDNKKVDSGYRYEHRSGITNYSIDLKSVANCNHNWTFSGLADKAGHKMSCSKCKWDRSDAHSYIYEYDGIKENLCMCGKNKYVHMKYFINDDKTKEMVVQNEAYSEIEPHKYSKKTGHEFLYYKKYRIEIEDLNDLSEEETKVKKVFIENVHDIDMNVENNSLVYEAEYRPFTYYIQFNIENNYNLEFDSMYIDMQLVVYDEPSPLFECKLKKQNYNFMGWAVKPDMSKVVFLDEAEVVNLTDVDNDIVNLYPVFLPYTYTVYYTYDKDPDYIVKKEYTFDEEIELEDFEYELGDGMSFVGWDIMNDTLKNATTKHLEQYLSEDKQVLYLNANVYTEPKIEETETDNDNDKDKNKNDDSGGNSNNGGGSSNGGNSGGGSGTERDTDYPNRPNNNNNNNNSNNVVEGTGEGTPPYNNGDNSINNNSNNSNNQNKNNSNNNKSANNNKTNNNSNNIVDSIEKESKSVKKFTAGMVNLLNVKKILSRSDKNKLNDNNNKASKSIVYDVKNTENMNNKPSNHIFSLKMLKNIGIISISGLFLIILVVFIIQTYKKFIKLEKKYKS